MMKKLLLLLFFLSSLNIFSQSTINSKERISLESCSLLETSDRINCYNNKLKEMFLDEFIVLSNNGELSPNSEIKCEINIVLSEQGFFQLSSIESENKKVEAAIREKIESLEKVFPVKDKNGRPTRNEFSMMLNINIDSSGKINLGIPKQKIAGFEEDINISVEIIEKVPVYPGCSEKTNEAQKKCMSQKFAELIGSQFDYSIVNKLNLPKGLARIFVNFKINKKGKLTDIVARADREELEKEAIRVLKKVPRLKPGEQKGEPVGVLYSLPIVLRVE